MTTPMLFTFQRSSFFMDPHFGKRSRGVDLTALPDPIAVLLSSTRPWKLDVASFRYIASGVPVIVPEGGSRILKKHLRNLIVELPHWSAYTLPDGTVVTAQPASSKGTNAYELRQGEEMLSALPRGRGR